ncbi:CpaD family pilus assembly protein [Qipengyuania sp. 6B39]|uniref:CpaD family pilus assembly protein n=1 Tax=Qipengyuania proteolytica TaxID=2867239 RepID=UPI001C8929C3|nr:CpaD family pilus assembly protein [Qipengyuania proteolytica]MBX7496687.1 CpaD family pilus assembly protein [Qipengyuania proteolytica]
MRNELTRKSAAALALSLSLALGACGGMADNPSLYSTKQPVVERTHYTLDVNTSGDSLPVSEQQRLLGWFESMELRYGDRVSVDDATASAGVRDAVAKLAGRYGLLLANGAPPTEGYVTPGQARVVISRTVASVPGCPDWSAKSDINYGNATYPNYGCAVNSNMAAMVANPEDLVSGQQGTGETVILSSNKAIDSYRDQEPTGAGGLREVSSTEGGN